MMSAMNREYAVSPLVIDKIDEVDTIRLVQTKHLIVYGVIQVILAISAFILGLLTHAYIVSLTGLLNIAIVLLCVNRYEKFNEEFYSKYMHAREAVYGDKYEDVYLNEERMIKTYGELCEMVRYVTESIRTNHILNISIISSQIFYILLSLASMY